MVWGALWCAEREVPAAANLNLYGQEGSHVAWHSNNGEMFGVGGWRMVIMLVMLTLIFVGVVEHRLIPAKFRHEWSRLR